MEENPQFLSWANTLRLKSTNLKTLEACKQPVNHFHMNSRYLLLLCFIFPCVVQAQFRLDVAGNARVQGHFDLSPAFDSTSLFLGRGANLTDTFSTANTLIGFRAGAGSPGISRENVIVGSEAGRNNVSSRNVYVGYQSAFNGNIAFSNIILGYQAAFLLRNGSYNVYIGSEANRENSSGFFNVAIGERAGYSIRTGSSNVLLGAYSAENSETYTRSLAIGFAAAQAATGNQNVLLGYRSGQSVNGDYNTLVGPESGENAQNMRESAFLGWRAGRANQGDFNTFVGARSGENNTEGGENTFIGQGSGFNNTTGDFNTFLGRWAGLNNLQGNSNTFLGYNAGINNQSGNANVAVGTQAGHNNIAAGFNTYVGFQAGYTNTNERNTLVGYQTGYNLGNGSSNTMLGFQAGFSSTNGSGQNTFIGESAGRSNETGDRVTILGFNADVAGTNLLNATALGANAIVDANNKVRIGDSNVAVIEANVNFGASSDRRLKRNIRNDALGLAFIQELRPVTYQRNKGDTQTRYNGFIAQEVEAAAQKVGQSFSGVVPPASERGYYSLRYAEFTVPLVKATQEQQQIINAQQEKIDQLARENQVLQEQISGLITRIEQLEMVGQPAAEQELTLTQANLLEQNEPNPFGGETRIRYRLNDSSQKATLIITTVQGQIIRNMPLPAKSGWGMVTIQANDLPAGVYSYTLMVNEQRVATRKLVRQ